MVWFAFLNNIIAILNPNHPPPPPPPPLRALTAEEKQKFKVVLNKLSSTMRSLIEGVTNPIKKNAFKDVLEVKIIMDYNRESDNDFDNTRSKIIVLNDETAINTFIMENIHDVNNVKGFIENQNLRVEVITCAINQSTGYVPVIPNVIPNNDYNKYIGSIAYEVIIFINTIQNANVNNCTNLLEQSIMTQEQAYKLHNIIKIQTPSSQVLRSMEPKYIENYETYLHGSTYDLINTCIAVFCCFKINPETINTLFRTGVQNKDAKDAAAAEAVVVSNESLAAEKANGYDSNGGGKIKRRKRRKRRRTIKKRKGVVRRTKRSRK